jgi:hypothetical protein
MTDSYELLTALLQRAASGALPPKKAKMLEHLHQKVVTAGFPINEAQAELLAELGQQYLP